MSSTIPFIESKSFFPEDREFEVIASGRDFEYETGPWTFHFRRYSPSGLLAIHPLPAPEALSTIYPDHYEPYLFHELPPLIRWARNLVQKSKIQTMARLFPPNARLLDVGCGNGALLLLMKELGPKSWQLFGNDLEAKRLERLKPHGISVICQSIFDLSPQEGKFDGIILNQVIEHFHDVPGLVRQCRNLLNEGGHLWIETPCIEGFDFRLFQKRWWGGYHFPRHFYLFSSRNLPAFLTTEGFRDISVGFLLSPAFWIQSCHHWLLDSGYPRLARLFSIRNPLALVFFSVVDRIGIFLGRPTSNMRVIAKK